MPFTEESFGTVIARYSSSQVAKTLVALLKDREDKDSQILNFALQGAISLIEGKTVDDDDGLTIGDEMSKYLKDHPITDIMKLGRLCDHLINQAVCRRMVKDWEKS